MFFFDLNEPVTLDPIIGDRIEESVSADVVNACDGSDGVVEESVLADVVNACDGSDGVVEEFFSADVVNASDSSDLLINYVSSSSDVVAVSNDDQNACCKFIFGFYKYHL